MARRWAEIASNRSVTQGARPNALITRMPWTDSSTWVEITPMVSWEARDSRW